MKTIWERATGKARQVDVVDFNEIMRLSPELYTDVAPKNAEGPSTEAKKGGDKQPKDDGDGYLMPRDMTVAQLKAALDEKGVQYDAGLRKDDLVALANIAEIKIKKED